VPGRAAITGAIRTVPRESSPVEHPLDRLALGAVPDLPPAQVINEVIAECGRQEQ
jgi:hypothetical protein